MTPTLSLGDLLFPHRSADGTLAHRLSDDELLALEAHAPVHPAPRPEDLSAIDSLRERLRMSPWDEHFRYPLPDDARDAGCLVRTHIEHHYVESASTDKDQLYLLEFQGPLQYLMLGHTRNLSRRIADHHVAAERHGYALLNGWPHQA